MKVTVLMEDSSSSPLYLAEHGLSLYIEACGRRVLSDTGASPTTWINAEKLGIDLSDVDAVFLSHGHYDHTGGLLSFAEKYPGAKLYMQSSADGAFYNGERYIGPDPAVMRLPGMRLLEGDTVLDDCFSVFTHITGRHPVPKGNRKLTRRTPGGAFPDDFRHEMCLVIRENEKTVLFSGCAHTGILNISDRFRNIYGRFPDAVFSGFHMIQKDGYTPEDLEAIRTTARRLSACPTVFYTGHCTGDTAYGELKAIMGDQLHRIRAGSEVTL